MNENNKDKPCEECNKIFDLKIRDFNEDFLESLKYKPTWEKALKRIFGEDIEITWKDCKVAQIDFGCDVLIRTKKGRKYSIDVKTRRNDYYEWDNYLIEIAHHIYTDSSRSKKVNTKEGWLYCSDADYIIIGTLDKDKKEIVEICGFSLIPFKDEEFKSEISILKNKWAATNLSNGMYQLTLNKQVNINFLKDNAIKFWYIKGGLNGNTEYDTKLPGS